MSGAPLVSVVIPTRNRAVSLIRTLQALARQDLPPASFEVIVTIDGSTDDTAALIERHRFRYRLSVTTLPGVGAAAARNSGAAKARAPLLLFLDDDVEPAEGLISAHVDAHSLTPGAVVVGPYLPPFRGADRLHAIMVREWWGRLFAQMAQLDHRFTFRDVLTGNLSLPAKLFLHVGGFNPAIPGAGGEDWELGVRLLAENVQLVFAPAAWAIHHESSTPFSSLRRARQEGLADVRIASLHPCLLPTLMLSDWLRPHRGKALLHGAAFRLPRLVDTLLRPLPAVLDLVERLRLRRTWRCLGDGARYQSYWRGVASALGSAAALRALLAQAHPPTRTRRSLTIDLREGLLTATRRIDRERPDSLHLRYGQISLGEVPPAPGSEALRAVHLSSLLEERAAALLLAMAAHGDNGRWPRFPPGTADPLPDRHAH